MNGMICVLITLGAKSSSDSLIIYLSYINPLFNMFYVPNSPMILSILCKGDLKARFLKKNNSLAITPQNINLY